MNRNVKAMLLGGCIGIALAVLILGVAVLLNCRFRLNGDQQSEIQSQNEQQSQSTGGTETLESEVKEEIRNMQEVPETDILEQDREYAADTVLRISEGTDMYTYDDLVNDVELLAKKFPDLVTAESLGKTADGREIYHVIVGNPQAEHKIFISGSIHGREYMSTQLVMKQMVTYLQHIQDSDRYNGMDYTVMWENCAIHVVPMINPDGVTISQYGLEGLMTPQIRAQVEAIAVREGGINDPEYFRRWKSNANGVDINRNFDALWDEYQDGVGMPSADHYKGTSPGCEIESASLIALTEKEQFDVTVSYHTQGSVIYWYFGQEGELYENTKSIADTISALTGYPTDANYKALDPAGYKDWGISKMGIPGLTVEIGTGYSPVPAEQFEGIWSRNQYVWETLVDWIL